MVRHSGCTRADVEFQLEEDSLTLRLSDNGKGFDTTGQNDGHGLVSMSERARDIGGHFDITSITGHGTTIMLKVPFDSAARTDIQ